MTKIMKKHVLMIVYTDYLIDARVRREAETLALLDEFDVAVIAPKQNDISRNVTIDGVHLIQVKEKKYAGKKKLKYFYSYIKFFILSFFVCTRRFLLGKVDLVHVHNMPDFLIFAGIIPRLFKKKLILDIHDSMPETYSSKFDEVPGILFKILCTEESLSAALAHKVICVNHIQKQILVNRGIPKKKILVSMNVPDPKRFSLNGSKKANVRNNKAFKMIYHGTITKRLGVDLAVEAVALLKNKIPGLEFHIWGKSGDELEAIDNLSRVLNVENRVHIIKEGVPLEKLPGKLKAMDLGVIGNRNGKATELMLPVKMLEYIALEIPVVAPRLRCIEHYFSEDMVTYFEPENVEAMAEAILNLYQDQSMRKKQVRNAKRFFDLYGWETHQMDLINLYRELV